MNRLLLMAAIASAAASTPMSAIAQQDHASNPAAIACPPTASSRSLLTVMTVPNCTC